ncbi:KinB signaling pathway activation protein [Fictibacillus macauensis ZFHKF-1]|uniref:KinB signaling pathway activation protein n=1 Tax=Fictibacillus macauensis ZFHKF-1 TaxID=1196324 RepID=I8AF92_9BACL|nr:KinB-signaling pathway activation protein [Fictibacillus macauensis]EIT84014.1 KinB signaling pathway activation protein [Fictibacillus macauensis ZFHKF-1]
MKSRNWVFLFVSTLLLGIGCAFVAGLLTQFPTNGSVKEFFLYLLGLAGFGALFSVFSQMGFFAYLTVHRFGLGVFKSHSLWNGVQIVLISVTLFDLFYLRYTAFYKEGQSMLSYILVPVGMFVLGLVVAYVKRVQTNKGAFVPTLFFVIVVTSVEWVPVLKTNAGSALWMGIATLGTCNVYQILMLHRLIRKNQRTTEKTVPKQKQA